MSEPIPINLRTALIDEAPMPMVCLNTSEQIVWLNSAAIEMGLTTDQPIVDFLPDCKGDLLDKLKFQPASSVFRFEFPHQEKRCQIKWSQQGDFLLLWLLDVTEKLAIANRIRDAEQPANRKFRQLNQLATTASGYAELLDVVLEDEQLFADKLTAVRQYQAEVNKNLAAMLDIMRGDQPHTKNSGTIVVADANQDLANLISELLRTEGYRAESFTDGNSVLRFLKVNADSVSGAVLDENLDSDDGSLLQAIDGLEVSIDVIMLSHCDDAEAEGKISKPVDFEVLLRRLQASIAK